MIVPCLSLSFNPLMVVYDVSVRKPLLWLLSILIIFILLALAAGVVLNRWLSGEGFHTLLEQKSSEALHAKTSFGELHWGWLEISSPRFNADGQGGTSLRKMEAGGLHGRLDPTGLLQGLWRVQEISLEHASIHIDSARHPKDASLSVHQQIATPPPSLPSWIPTLLEIDLIRSQKTDVLIELPSGMAIDIQGTHLEARPEGHETRFEARGGTLKSPFLPDLRLNSLRCRIKSDLVDLTGAELGFPLGGILQLEGNFPDAKESFLTGHWEKVPIATLLPSYSKQLLGTVDGNATVSWDLAGVHTVAGNLRAHDVTLSEIPMLDAAARFTGMEQFRHLPVQKVEASFSTKNGITQWNDVVLESRGMMKLIGSGSIAPDSVSGSLWLGLPSSIVAHLPGAVQVFSGNGNDGFLWTPLSVGGTLTHPSEDLTQRLTAAALGNVANTVLQGVQQLVKPFSGATNALPTNAIPAASDAAKGAMDILGGFLK